VAGPWTHIPWSRHAGETDFGPEACLDTDLLHLRWFDHWLKDSGSFSNEPRIRLFAQGIQRWHAPERVHLATVPGAKPPTEGDGPVLRYHLHSDGRANSARGDGQLGEAAPDGNEPRDMFVNEPEVPVGSPGPNGTTGQFNQTRSGQLNNVLIYTGPVLDKPVHVCGAPRVDLFATSRQPHADLFVKLVRRTADGRALNVCHGIARSSWLFRETGHQPDLPHRWRFELEPTSCVFGTGERISVEISGSAFPLYDRNPGGGTPPHLASPRDWCINQQQILHTRQYPSSIWLPLAE
jgi:putative CocE/NonD family hydrolase